MHDESSCFAKACDCALCRSAFVDDEAALSGSEDGSSDDDSEDQDAFEADFIDMASQPVCSQQLG